MNGYSDKRIMKTEFVEHLKRGVRYVGNCSVRVLHKENLEQFFHNENHEKRILISDNPNNLQMERISSVEGAKPSTKYAWLTISGQNIEIFKFGKVLVVADENDIEYLTLYLIDHE